MRFRLLLEAAAAENAINILLNMDKPVTPEEKEDFIEAGREVIGNTCGTANELFSYVDSGNNDSIKLVTVIKNMILKFGQDRFKKVIAILAKVPISKISNSDCFTNFIALANAYQAGQLTLEEPFLLNHSLYSRGTLDFDYAIKVLKIASNPNELAKYYGKSENVKYEDLFVGEDIKPSGAVTKNASDDSTIYGTVEIWKIASGKGEKTALKKDDHPEFTNFEDAKKSGSTLVKINGIFKYNKDAQSDFKWEPVNN